MSEPKTIVAVLDDEPKMRVALKRLLGLHGFDVVVRATWDGFLSAAEDRHLGCLVLDLHMPGLSGFEILDQMASMPRPVPTVVITGRNEPGNAARVRGLGAVNYLLKPLDETSLVQAIHDAIAGEVPSVSIPADPDRDG
ncbi:MAG: response regulator transcription factor [Verrucomicrobiales bacterium]